jgi:hypothetical protein
MFGNLLGGGRPAGETLEISSGIPSGIFQCTLFLTV